MGHDSPSAGQEEAERMQRSARIPGIGSPAARVGRALVVALAAASVPFAAAHSPVDPATVEGGHPTGHVHDRADRGWPPEPRGISGVVLFSDPAAETRARDARRRQTEADEATALRRAPVLQALGSRHRLIGLQHDSGKRGELPSRRLVYFSHDRRATVEVLVDERGEVTGVRSTPAAQYQPEITEEEIAEAAALARAHFLARGRARVAGLEAFGILAYPPGRSGFYATRVLYVSFHPAADAAPEYSAWVDLTRQRVVKIREEQP
jgi:hypothetical protein